MKFIVQHSKQPSGNVRVSGAKNAATRLMAAALLTEEPVTLCNFPTQLYDVRHKARFIEALGACLQFDEQHCELTVKADRLVSKTDMDFSLPVRTTYLLAAGQLMRTGLARIPYPGGCKLGERKYDLHTMVWERFGASVQERDSYIEIKCQRIRGADVTFPLTTVGGTENALLCAVIAKGATHIRNAYVPPEVENLISLLRAMGASIEMRGSSEIIVEGQEHLHGARLSVMPDRIEALTWMVYAVVAGGSVRIDDVPLSSMEVPLVHLQAAGVDYFRNSTSVYLDPSVLRSGKLQPFELACGTHPGVISDMQPFFVLLALCASGRSLIVDYRYPDRTAYLAELAKFAPGSLSWTSGRICVDGPADLRSAAVESTDLRGSMVLVLASLLAGGGSAVERVEMALRGYNDLPAKLRGLGGDAVFFDESDPPPESARG